MLNVTLISEPALQEEASLPRSLAAASGTAPKKRRQPSLDSLLKTRPELVRSQHEEQSVPVAPGIFVGFRFAMLFNAALGVASLLGYEIWAMLLR